MRDSLFDLIAGLPVHPLVDHVVVVFIPLFSLLQILIILRPSLRKQYARVATVGLGISLVAAFVAKQSGEALASRIGLPFEHAEAGERVVTVSVALFTSALVWLIIYERPNLLAKNRVIIFKLVSIATALLAVIAIVVTFLAGHSGATATWESKIGSGTPNSVPSATSPETVQGGIILSTAEVAKHSTISDCWTIVNENVYNLTSFASQHPGGKTPIESLCGIDGTSAFTGQHGGASRPNNELSNFQIGVLGESVTNTTP